MFMRTVKMFVKESEVHSFRTAYQEHILEEFAKVKGCRYAALLQSTHNPEECISTSRI